jgi:CP family cyanate transporter-like MFS transporter
VTRSDRRPDVGRFATVWLIGFSVRVTVLAIPPLLPSIRRDLALSNTEIAALTTLPILLLGVAASLGSAIVRAAGARRAIVAGLVVTSVAAATRGIGSSPAWLFGFTFLMGLGIASVQPAVPSLVRAWMPAAVGRATAVYVNGILLSEAAAASLTLPVLVPLVGGWEPALAIWSLPVLGTAAIVAAQARPTPVQTGPGVASWIPAFWERQTWRLGLFQAAGSIAYFASNAVLPVFLDDRGLGGRVGWTLAVLNTSQLVAPLLVGTLPLRVCASRGAGATAGAALVAAALATLAVPELVVLWAFVLGTASAFVFTVALTLPAALADGTEVARLSAGMFTIGYGLAFLVPLAGGALWDAVGSGWAALAPVAAAGVCAITVGGVAVPGGTGTVIAPATDEVAR